MTTAILKTLYPIILSLMKTRAYKWLLLHVIPYIRFSLYYTSFKGWKYRRGYKLLRPGHIILTRDNKKMTTLLIGGEFTHAAVCVAKGEEWEVSEMTHTNYTKSAFFDICKEADRVVLLRCLDFDDDYIQKFIYRCKEFHRAQYDGQFLLDEKLPLSMPLGVEFLYCSELAYESDFERRLKVSLEDKAGLGKPYISPTGLFKAKNVVVDWDSDQEVSPW